ncbi:hypothetical protein L9F63_007019, partial [Diploptera punctata]
LTSVSCLFHVCFMSVSCLFHFHVCFMSGMDVLRLSFMSDLRRLMSEVDLLRFHDCYGFTLFHVCSLDLLRFMNITVMDVIPCVSYLVWIFSVRFMSGMDYIRVFSGKVHICNLSSSKLNQINHTLL